MISFEGYLSNLIPILFALGWFAKSAFMRTTVFVSGMIHYGYVFILKALIIREPWQGTLQEILVPIGVSVIVAIIAYIVPSWRQAWSKNNAG